MATSNKKKIVEDKKREIVRMDNVRTDGALRALQTQRDLYALENIKLSGEVAVLTERLNALKQLATDKGAEESEIEEVLNSIN